MTRLRSIFGFFKRIYDIYVADRPTHFAASLAYYSLFSLVPIIYIAFSLAGMFVDNAEAMQRMFIEVERLLGADAVDLLKRALDGISQRPLSANMFDRVVGVFAMFFGASLLFFRLQHTLNTIWKVPSSGEGQTQAFLVNRLLALGMVLLTGILIVVSALTHVFASFLQSILHLQVNIPFLNAGSSFVIGVTAVTLIFKLLPSARLGWKDAIVGGVVTELLLTSGAQILGWYMAKGNIGSAFEAAGTVAVVLVSIYFLAQLFIFGVVFTRVFAETYGSGIAPR